MPKEGEQVNVPQFTPPARDGWTLWREIYGTVLGTLPFVIGLILAWNSLTERVRVMEVNHEALKATMALELANLRGNIDSRDRQNDRDREQIIKSLDRISAQIEALQARR